jgi:hypothetical protein
MRVNEIKEPPKGGDFWRASPFGGCEKKGGSDAGEREF